MMMECRDLVDQVKSEVNVIKPDRMMSVETDKTASAVECKECMELQAEFAKNPGGLPPRRAGLIIASVVGGAGLAITTICVPFVLPALRRVCLPFVPATSSQLNNVRSALQGRTSCPPARLLDIGSGDGRIVIQAATDGFQATGVELNRWLVYYSRWSAWRSGVRASASFVRQDLWQHDTRQYNNVVIFGVEQMMSELESKLERELAPGSLVVACRFKFPHWVPDKEIGTGVDTVWTYQR